MINDITERKKAEAELLKALARERELSALKSGFHIDPINGNETTEKLVNFFKRCKEDKNYWKKISDAGITRVDKSFNWELYSKNLLSLAKIYGFWRYTTNLEMSELNAYLDLMYHTLYKPRAERMLEVHASK